VKQLVIGIGTGRCGTNSLAALLNSQPDCFFSHESYRLDWEQRAADCPQFDDFKYLLDREEPIAGDVSLGLSAQAKELMKRFEGLKVVCLRRDREKLIQSLIRASGGEETRSYYQTHPEDSPYHSDYWYHKFPKFPVDDKRKAVKMYITEHYHITSALYNAYPDRVFIMDIAKIDDRIRLDRLFDFVGVSKEGRVYDVPKFNVGTPDGDDMWKNPEQVQII
jgi:hypothetical protein